MIDGEFMGARPSSTGWIALYAACVRSWRCKFDITANTLPHPGWLQVKATTKDNQYFRQIIEQKKTKLTSVQSHMHVHKGDQRDCRMAA